jgi:hypothetical protein
MAQIAKRTQISLSLIAYRFDDQKLLKFTHRTYARAIFREGFLSCCLR